MKRIWHALCSIPAIICLAIFATLLWIDNIRSMMPPSSPPSLPVATAPDPTPRKSAEEILGLTPVNLPQPTAVCSDGVYSYSRTRRGACSHHGGVAKWF